MQQRGQKSGQVLTWQVKMASHTFSVRTQGFRASPAAPRPKRGPADLAQVGSGRRHRVALSPPPRAAQVPAATSPRSPTRPRPAPTAAHTWRGWPGRPDPEPIPAPSSGSALAKAARVPAPRTYSAPPSETNFTEIRQERQPQPLCPLPPPPPKLSVKTSR